MRSLWPEDAQILSAAPVRRNRELVDYIEHIAEQPFDFSDEHPNRHSSRNHQHLWLPEYLADRDPAIDAHIRTRIAAYILNRWRVRLVGFAPYQMSGYRFYFYQDMAPTLSVVGETPFGFPYDGCANFKFVETVGEVMKHFENRSWASNFSGIALKPEAVSKACKASEGSLRRTSETLSIGLSELRRFIEHFDMAQDVNAIRKHHGRRPAAFANSDLMLPDITIWEHCLPAGYKV